MHAQKLLGVSVCEETLPRRFSFLLRSFRLNVVELEFVFQLNGEVVGVFNVELDGAQHLVVGANDFLSEMRDWENENFVN